MKRRSVLQAVAAVAGAPSLGAASDVVKGTVYARLGVKPLINGMGTVTVVGGSLMPPEVVRAMEEASRHFVYVPDLQQKAGARIAELVGVPAAMVTAGAASSITVATAAAMTKGDPKKIAQLPDTTGLPFEVIQQGHSGYEAQILLTGARIVTVETREELDRAIGERTAMMFFLNYAEPNVRIKRDEWVRVARERGVVSFNDAAADVPPREHLSQYVREGFDLVAFSGGKGLRGPAMLGPPPRPQGPDRRRADARLAPRGHRPRHEGGQGGDRRPGRGRRALHDGRPRGRAPGARGEGRRT